MTIFIAGFFRIIYLGRLLQQYIISANSELQKIRKLEPSKRDANQLSFQQNSLKMAENTLYLTKMLAHKSPSFVFVITPSWKIENRYIFNYLWYFLKAILFSKLQIIKNSSESETTNGKIKRSRNEKDLFLMSMCHLVENIVVSVRIYFGLKFRGVSTYRIVQVSY